MTIMSMTGFSTQEIVAGGQTWVWDLRSVNGRGLDLKIRLPEGADRYEPAIREKISEGIHRGTVHVSLRRVGREAVANMPGPEQLDRLFAQIATVQSAALRAGVALDPVRATDILDGRLLQRLDGQSGMTAEQMADLMPGLATALAALLDMRRAEGHTQLRLLTQLINRIAELVAKARALEHARGRARAEVFATAMRRVLSQDAELDPGRLEQELAALAVKADVAEELNRLDSHVEAARSYLTDNRPVGRKLDFLTQEFNREANTLCSKAQFSDLTRVGLDLKAAIDQVREQVQNVE